MSVRKFSSILTVLFLVLLLAPFVFAQGAQWVEFDLRQDWKRTSYGFCGNESQCLVSNSFNDSINVPETYWDGLINSSLGPKCIYDKQFIMDHYCMSGNWTSRTRLVAEQLLSLALAQDPSDFALYCDSYDKALNRFNYSSDFGAVEDFIGRNCVQQGFFGASSSENCVNNFCVLKYGDLVGFGTALNMPVDSSSSVLQALNLRRDSCNSAVNDDWDYDQCGANVWYNWNTNSLIYVPGVSRLDPPDPLVYAFYDTPFNKLVDYVFSNVHNPKVRDLDYSFFNATPDFNYLFMSKDGFEFVYSFKQENISLSQIDYAGWYFSNIDLPEDTCTRFVKRFDPSTRANCEIQKVPTEFYIVSNTVPPLPGFKRMSIVDHWSDLSGKLRVVS